MLLDSEFTNNPYPTYRSLLAESPIQSSHLFGSAWVVPRHADVVTLFRDPRLSARRSGVLVDQFPEEQRTELAEFNRLFSKWMLFYDAPEHTRIRGIMARGFTPNALAALRPRIQQVADELLDAARPKGRIEVMSEFAHQLPIAVITDLLGFPSADRPDLLRWSNDIATFFGSGSANIGTARAAQASLVALIGYIQQLLAARRDMPSNGLLSLLIGLGHGNESLTEEEVYAQCAMLLFAGHETTRNLIGNGLLALLRHPDQLSLLLQYPELAESAVQELLRYDSPVQFGSRLAMEDLEFHGVKIRGGELLILLLGAANHDPQEFVDPEKLDITRHPNRHVSFGAGPHFCLGSSLACLEAQIALTTLLTSFPDLRLEFDHVQWSGNLGFRGLTTLPVLFDNNSAGRSAALGSKTPLA